MQVVRQCQYEELVVWKWYLFFYVEGSLNPRHRKLPGAGAIYSNDLSMLLASVKRIRVRPSAKGIVYPVSVNISLVKLPVTFSGYRPISFVCFGSAECTEISAAVYIL